MGHAAAVAGVRGRRRAGSAQDARAFQEEAERRVRATRAAAARGERPASGDRILVVGYDTDQDKHAYAELPDEYLTGPGDAVTTLDGEDVGRFEAFIHAPFKDDCAAARNETSLSLQVTLTGSRRRRRQGAAAR